MDKAELSTFTDPSGACTTVPSSEIAVSPRAAVIAANSSASLELCTPPTLGAADAFIGLVADAVATSVSACSAASVVPICGV